MKTYKILIEYLNGDKEEIDFSENAVEGVLKDFNCKNIDDLYEDVMVTDASEEIVNNRLCQKAKIKDLLFFQNVSGIDLFSNFIEDVIRTIKI